MMLNRVSLNVVGLNRIGLNRIGSPSRGSSSGSDRSYIDPEVLASLKAVCICYGKSNDDPDRAIVKNLVDPDNPFVISNAAYKLNSGYGKYSADFESFDWTVGISQKQHNKASISLSGRLCNHAAIEVDEIKVNIIGNVTELIYWYIANPDDTARSEIRLTSGINTLPKSYAKDDGQTYNIGFAYISGDSEIIIEQIPSYQGAFVTDGVDDMITSTKTVQEMGITDEVTVVSMIHQISLNPTYNNGFTNYIENLDKSTYVRNNIYKTGNTGIYGYSASLTSRTYSDINNILGDKKDYGTEIVNRQNTLDRTKFSVVGRASNISEVSSIAWFWTIIANKVLTTDQINQVIAYYNLDRCVEPTVWYDVQKQGLTNETPAADWYLKDFSKNGFDMSLFNFAKKGGSGVSAKQFETFKDWTKTPFQTSTIIEIDEFTRIVDSTSNSYWVSMINRTSDFDKIQDPINMVLYQDNMLLVHECKYKIGENVTTKALYENLRSGVNTIILSTIDKFTDIPEDAEIMSLGEWINPKNNKGSVKITLLPSYEGALCFDGVEDYGKVTGLPIYKDYTVITDREIFGNIGAISSKNNPGAFMETAGNSVYSFGQSTSGLSFISARSISYLSKYSYCGQPVSAGTAEDGTNMWLGTIRDNDSRFFNGAIYSLMTFPYSMSEFLIERQLKKRKAGTLYLDMVEFRPIVKSNLPYSSISYSVNPGEYISVGSTVTITVTLLKTSDKLMEVSCNAISDISISGDNGVYEITGKVVNSPQKINLVISSYLTMLSNSTLISNETLIKNE